MKPQPSSPLEMEIETFLLLNRRWIPAAELCSRFRINERALRATGSRPGLCTRFAVSSAEGFMHVRHADTAAWLRFKHTQAKHAVAELRRIRQLGVVRHRQTAPVTPPQTKPAVREELATGQLVML